MNDDEDRMEPTQVIWTVSSDTRIEWLDEAYWFRPHWWSLRRRSKGTFFATHVAHPGAWGSGDTEMAALDELCDVIQDMATLDLDAL